MNDCPELIEIKKRSNTSLKEIALAFTVSSLSIACQLLIISPVNIKSNDCINFHHVLCVQVSMFKKNCNDIQWLNIFLLILTIMWEDIYLFRNKIHTSCSKKCGRTFISYTSLIGRCSTSSGGNKMIVCILIYLKSHIFLITGI